MIAKKEKMTRAELILQIIIFALGFFYAFVYYVRIDEPIDIQAASDQLFAYITAVLTAAFGIGVINLTRIHWRIVKNRRPAWRFSSVLLVSMYVMAVISLIAGPFAIDPKSQVIPESAIAFVRPLFEFLYYKVLVAINATLFSLLAFFIASAAYRAFKIRSIESTILLVAGLLVIIGQAPISDLIWPGFSAMRVWIMAYPNVAGQRGIYIGAALGILAFTIRRLFRYPWGR